jgi:hypothetical protein
MAAEREADVSIDGDAYREDAAALAVPTKYGRLGSITNYTVQQFWQFRIFKI